MEQKHISVLKKEVIDFLNPNNGKVFIDCTFGAGGHTKALLEAGAKVIAIDRDKNNEKLEIKLNNSKNYHKSDKIIEFIRENAPMYKIEGYDEKKNKGLLRHVVIRASAKNGANLVVLVINSDKVPERIKDFAQLLYDKFDKITGVTVNLNNQKTNLIMTDKTILLMGKDYVEEELCGINFKIGSNTFFQVNPKSAENIFTYVKDYVKTYPNPTVLDAYAGISAFGLVLSDVSKSVTTVEENRASVEKAKEVKRLNKFNNIELYCDDSEKFFEEMINNPEIFDITILDPPRKGCTEKTLKYALKLTKSAIIYVSCNPSTLARDLKYLIEQGAKVESVQPFDMFCHTPHIENVAIITK